jgi:arsenical resistance protein ArsH
LPDTFPALQGQHLYSTDLDALRPAFATHKPRILVLYGSLREVSYSRLLAFEARRLLERLGCETRIFDPKGLPLPDEAPASHAKVQELRDLSQWSEGQVWVSPERHGAMTGIMKSQIDWIPLSMGSIRPTQGKTLAIMEVSGGSQSFNAVRGDADDHHPQPVVGRKSLPGVRCRRPHEAIGILRPSCRRLRGTGEVHPADARCLRLYDGPV